MQRIHAALRLARELAYPLTLAFALEMAAELHQYRWEAQTAHAHAEEAIRLATAQGLPFRVAWGTILEGGACVEQNQGRERIGRIQQGLTAYLVTGAAMEQPYYLSLLAEAYAMSVSPERRWESSATR